MKKLAILLTIALLLSLFTGCQERQPGQTSASTGETQPDVTLYCPAPILQSRMDAIKKAYEGVPSSWEYYGTYDGYDILRIEGNFFTWDTEVIAGQPFSGTSMSLLAYKDGTFIDLADAYEQNLITKDAIKAASIWNNSTLGDAAMSCCPEVIDRQMQKYYESLWSNMGDESFGTWYTEDNPDGDWRYYGPHFLFYCGGEQEEVFTTIQIDGITFSHPTTFQLYALDSEPLTLISLAEYYEEWGNTETIAEIAQLHKQTNDAIYGEGWDSQENTQ